MTPVGEMSGEHPELDELQVACRDAVEAWISAIRKEEQLASVNHDMADVDAWEAARFEEDEMRAKVKDVKAKYEDALREEFFGFLGFVRTHSLPIQLSNSRDVVASKGFALSQAMTCLAKRRAWTNAHHPAARNARVMHTNLLPRKTERAQGKPGAGGTRGLACNLVEHAS